MKPQKRNRWWALLLVLALAGVAAAKVTVDWDHGTDFSKFRTYAWTPGTPARNQLMDQRIVEAIDSQLQAKGLQKVDSPENADLVVMYHAAVSQETQLNTTNFGGWGWNWGGSGMSTTTVDKIPVGQLSVDIGDAKTRKLLWMGSASDTLSDKPEKVAKKIQDVVEDMFKKFPPPTK